MLLLDNAPGHSEDMVSACSNITVKFLLPNTMLLLQPMVQGVISTFKAYYLCHVMHFVTSELEKVNAHSIIDIWKRYTLKDAINNIAASWV